MANIEKHDLNAKFDPNAEGGTPNLLFVRPGLKQLYLNLPPGTAMPEHDHEGDQVTVLCMVGEANMVIAGESHPLKAGELMVFSGAHRVEPRNDGDEPCGLLIGLSAEVID